MNKDQAKGAAKQAAGRVQRGIGQATDSERLKAQGLAREAEGRLQRAYGAIKEALKNSRHE
ncbi:MAG: CsbD family protein [Burkholderiales bacterium]|nr:CsbD family protein [Burkholderiales bacterium]